MQTKHLHSEVLDRTIELKVTTHAMRVIAKRGGLDQYLVTSPHVDHSIVGSRLRQAIVEKVLIEGAELRPPTVRKPKNRMQEAINALRMLDLIEKGGAVQPSAAAAAEAGAGAQVDADANAAAAAGDKKP